MTAIVIIILLFLPVSKPAPDWNGTAVINGEFKDIKLSDYRGKYLVFFFYPLDLYVWIVYTDFIAHCMEWIERVF